MKKWLPHILTGVFALWVLSALRPAPEVDGFRVHEFGRLPVLLNGRVQPLDSVARNTLLMIRGKQTVRLEDSKKLSATEWLLEVFLKPELADKRKIFYIHHPELHGVLNLPETQKYFSFGELVPHFEAIEREANRIREIESQLRSPYDKQIASVHHSLGVYHRLKNSLRPEGAEDFAGELELYRKSIEPGLLALQQAEAGLPANREDLDLTVRFFRRYQTVSQMAYPLVIPPVNPEEDRDGWNNIGTSLMDAMRSGDVHPATLYFATMNNAFRNGRPSEFNRAVAEYRQWLAGQGLALEVKKGQREHLFNQLQPFYQSMVVYVAALLLACAFWLNWSPWLRRSAFFLLGLAFVIHTTGLLFRMFLEGRPPVTNLYSSAIFIGWGAVVLGAILERISRDGIGIVTASSVGFITLIIAHHLSLSGDTMEMLQAVLDTNFWLATHVVVITIGYSSMFIAGFLALLYVIRGCFTRTLDEMTARTLSRMVYGIICFATLFSFVGTVLGGIWADQSWGRFWGWDPKENGALLIVIWCAIILHARWGKLVQDRSLMAMAIFGNIVTSFSWFGTNMLGVGLHSYGFMDKAFAWLLIFVGSQMLFIGLCFLPPKLWRSFRHLPPPAAGPPPGSAEPVQREPEPANA
jgi:ABC-type transport system involved in cytochrome c biogenesis permease subunit